jgi:hypothetical protein
MFFWMLHEVIQYVSSNSFDVTYRKGQPDLHSVVDYVVVCPYVICCHSQLGCYKFYGRLDKNWIL